jgi:3-oxoacyl-(acyl-carrier-protein) synthase
MNPRRRVAITGIGMVTPVGNDAPTTWANLVVGRSGVAPIAYFDARGPTHIGAEIKNFDAESVITSRKPSSSQLARIACLAAARYCSMRAFAPNCPPSVAGDSASAPG